MDDLGPIQTERLAREYLRDARHMEAMVVAKKGLNRFGDGPRFPLLLAEVYEAAGETDRAIEILEALLTRRPDATASERVARLKGE